MLISIILLLGLSTILSYSTTLAQNNTILEDQISSNTQVQNINTPDEHNPFTSIGDSELISEFAPIETLNCDNTITDAALSCQDYYSNLINPKTPEDFLNIYLVEDSEFVFGTQNQSQQILQAPSERNQLMTYIVQKGDSLEKIAKKFGISVDTIKLANRLTKTILQPGKELIILPVSGIYYTVQKGDTLSKIANTYKISVSSIIEYNGIDEHNIKIGDKIILPGAKTITQSTQSSYATNSIPSAINNTNTITGYYIYPTTGWNWGVLHNNNAVDIANSCGTPIYAAADGIVISISSGGGWNGGYGNSIKIQHPNGTTTLYAHLSSINIAKGASVKQGDFIGKMGSTGKATGCHLHFEVNGAKNPFVK